MKTYFLTGLAILMPVALTLIVIRFLFEFFTSPFLNVVEHFLFFVSQKGNFALPAAWTVFISRVLTLIFLFAFIFLLGMLARWFVIKNILAGTNHILSRIPFIKTVYKVSRDVIAALFSADEKKAFKYPVMFPFPHQSSFAIGFRAGEVTPEILEKVKTPLVSVFAPTAPHPISGFLLLIPETEVYKVPMTNEEALKYLVSCGLVQPEYVTKMTNHDIL